jgi:phytoene/squalene synthetase
MPTLTPQQIEDAARAMPDHTLATSFLEPDARMRVIGLVLFHHEIARARAVVSEAGLAAIRLQWWRDTIDQIYAGQIVRAQPTAIAIKQVIEEAHLPRTLFDAMIDGYESALDAHPFPTWSALKVYLDATLGNLNRLSLLVAGQTALTTVADHAACEVGIAWGLAHLMRATPSWLARRCSWLPEEACEGLDREALFAGQVTAQLRSILSASQGHIAKARNTANACLAQAKLNITFPALAHACLVTRQAKAAMPAIGNEWRVKPDASLLTRQISMTLSVARGRI